MAVTTRAMEGQFKELMAAITALTSEMKAGQEEMKEEMKAGQEEMKAGQEEMKAGQEEMKEEMKAGKEEMKAGQEEMKARQEELKNNLDSVKEVVEKRLSTMGNKIAEMEEKVDQIEENFEEKVSSIKDNLEKKFEEKVSSIEESLGKKFEETVSSMEENLGKKFEEKVSSLEENLGKKLEEKLEKKIEDNLNKKMCSNSEIESRDTLAEKVEYLEKQMKNLPAGDISKCDLTLNRTSIKLSTYDGKSPWQVYKTQFSIVAEANRWDPATKACHLAASLRGDAADILQTLPEEQRHSFDALSNALELRFGESCLKDFSRLQLKSRFQKAGENLQELASDVERLSYLAYADYPADVRENLSLQHFMDGIRDPDLQRALRLTDIKDLKSALVYSLKFEAAQQTSRRERHSVRVLSAEESDSSTEKLQRRLQDLEKEIRSLKGNRSRKVQCWNCGREDHIRRNCPDLGRGENSSRNLQSEN